MLTFFPAPYPDELLYSILARYHVRSGNTSSKMTMTELFNTDTVTAVVDMPSGLNVLAKRIPYSRKIRPYDLMLGHTLFPYYTAFLPESRAKSVVATMRGNMGGAIHTMTGIMASTIRVPEYLRFCPACAKEDREKFGEFYWHRFHQIPGVILCPQHETFLLDSTVKLHSQNRHEFIPAEEQNCINRPIAIKYDNTDIERLLQLSKDIEWCVRNYDAIRETVRSNNGLRECYLSLLKDKGFATVNGRVYQDELLVSFKEFHGKSFLRMVQSDFDCSDESNWLSGIVRKHRKAFHPIRHLLLIRFLSSSLDDFFRDPGAYQPFGKGPWPCLNAAADHYKMNIIKNVTITHCSDTKLPVGNFKCSCGFVYSRRGPDTSKDDIYKIGRIKQFGPMWEDKLRKTVLTENLGLRETARRLHVDPGTVKKYIKKLGVSVKQSNLCDGLHDIGAVQQPEYIPADSDTLQEQHRGAWLEVQSSCKSASKTELRRIAKAHYAWLYRHDREWLDKNSPQSKLTKVDNLRVNWVERDKQVLYEVKQAVKDILAIKEKPIRICLSRIGKMIGLLGLLEKHLDKMPMTEAYIQAVSETDSDYRKRKIRWAVEELIRSGKEPKVWNVMREAGIRTEYTMEFENYVLNEIYLNGLRHL